MTQNAVPESLESMDAYPTWEAAEEAAQGSPRANAERPAVTFMGNTYDLTALGAVISGLLTLFMCLSCNMGMYCLPFLPLVLGAIGLVAARDSVNEERTRLWSWIGIGIGGAFFLLIVLSIIGFVALYVLGALAWRRGY